MADLFASQTFDRAIYLAAQVIFKPNTSIEVKIDRFVRWYRDYYGS